jgi:hypothetical protein
MDNVGNDDLSKINADNKLHCLVANYLDSATRQEQVKNYVIENQYY